MSRLGYYKSPEGQAELRKRLDLSADASTEELEKSLELQLYDAGVWAEAQSGDFGNELHEVFGLTIDCETKGDGEELDASIIVTDYDRHVRLAELHTAIAGLHEMLGSPSEFAKDDEIAERYATNNRIDRRGAIKATKARPI